MLSYRFWVLSSLMGLIALLSGCASAPRPLSDMDFAKAMEASEKQVSGLIGEKKAGEAVAMLNRMAAENPTRKAPWARLAKLYFDQGSYGEAIVASDEVLQRDPADRVAKSIRAVSGLRVATRSLADLRNDEDMKGSARADAVSLAKVLRETLGEEVLVPPVDKEAQARAEAEEQARAKARARARYLKRKAAEAASKSSEPVVTRRDVQVNGDPFSVLE